jgi:nucleotide-binding universal stress UspA family protein
MKFLIPIDFSEASAHMLRAAFDLNRHFFASLQILHLFDVPITAGDDSELYLRNYEAYRKSYDDELWEFVRLNRGEFHYDTEVFATSGGHYQGIVSFARAQAPDLIIIGHKGAGKLRRWMLGSVSRYLLTHPPVPVLSIPENFSFPGKEGFRRILLTTDLSMELPEAQVRFLTNFAERMQAEIRLLHVKVKGEVELPSEAKMLKSLRETFGREVEIVPQEPEEHVHEKVARYVGEHDVDLLVTFPHFHTWIDRLLIGSETRELTDTVRIPILSLPGNQ